MVEALRLGHDRGVSDEAGAAARLPDPVAAAERDPRARWRTLPAATPPTEHVMTQAVLEVPMTEPDEDRELIKRFGTF